MLGMTRKGIVMATNKKTDVINETQEEQEQPQNVTAGAAIARLMEMQAALEARFKELEEREAALKAKEDEEYGTGPRETDVVLSKAWEEEREVFLPYATQGEEQWVMVAVNGRKYQVPRGMPLKVPLPLYERIMIMLTAQAQVARYRNSLPNEAAPGQVVRVG